MELNGTIKKISPVKQVSDKFKTREFVLTVPDEKYPQHIALQCVQAKCELLDNLKVGDSVTASCNLRGKEYTTKEGEIKYFNSIEAWKIEKVAGQVSSPASKPEDDTDLPF